MRVLILLSLAITFALDAPAQAEKNGGTKYDLRAGRSIAAPHTAACR